MKTSFTSCNECVVYHNWHRMGDWKKSFIKIVGELVDVPINLANYIRGQIPDKVKLEVPDGKTYNVQVSKDENGLVFQSGWAEFARTYELVQGTLLLFESSGSSCFEVRMFNQTGCEKELSCVPMNNTPCVNKMRFFMVMMGIGASNNGLTIPEKFANYVRGHISEEIKLEVPDGQTYSVQVDNEQNELVLRSGWDTFVSAYELKEGDTLLFGYNGNSQFKVRIFDVNGFDKLLSCVVKNITPCVQKRSAYHDNPLQSPRERTGPNDHRNKACTICIECAARHYWHMEDHNWSFFKVVILGNFKDEMAIPPKFATNFRGRISDEVKLEVPDGKIYNVQVAEEQHKLVLRSGWANFAGAYELKEGDLLVFTYSGDSHFKVKIFKPSGCENEFSCVTMSCGPNVQERDICHDQSLPTKKRCQNDGLSDSWKTTKKTPTDSPSQKPSSELNTEGVTSSKDIQEPRGSGVLQGSSESRYILEMSCKLTSAQRAGVDTFVKESQTGIEFYVTAMNEKTLSDGYLVICKEYAVKHLPHQDQMIKLCHPQNSKTWDANLAVISDGACTLSCILTAGWLGFVRDNNLREGDICAFEVSKNDCRVMITVHPLKESGHPEYVITGHTKPARQQKKKWTHPGYVVTRSIKLTRKQKRKIEERIQAIQPEIKIFVSVLQRSRYSLYIEQGYADCHLPREDQTMRLRLPGKNDTWKAKLYVGDEVNGKFNALRRGWKKFVKDNKLQEGDMCLFELLKNEEELTMNVHIIKA
ncbi:hypothetical protein ACQJBY_042471 [Aegilops geniculata]